jgi:hypothetical protein
VGKRRIFAYLGVGLMGLEKADSLLSGHVLVRVSLPGRPTASGLNLASHGS